MQAAGRRLLQTSPTEEVVVQITELVMTAGVDPKKFLNELGAIALAALKASFPGTTLVSSTLQLPSTPPPAGEALPSFRSGHVLTRWASVHGDWFLKVSF